MPQQKKNKKEEQTVQTTSKSVEKAPKSVDMSSYVDIIKKRSSDKNLRKGQFGETLIYRITKGRKPRNWTFKCKDVVRLPRPSQDPKFFEDYSFVYELTPEARSQGKTGYNENGNPVDEEWIFGDNLRIQVADGESFLFDRNQSKEKKVIKFINFTGGGFSLNTEKDKTLYKFISICNANRDFKYRNKQKSASLFHDDDRKNMEKEMAQFNLLSEAQKIVHTASYNDIISLCLTYGIREIDDEKTARFKLLKKATDNPKEFLQWYQSPSTEVKAEYMLAKEYGILSVVGNQLRMKDGSAILTIPKNANEQEHVSNFFMNEDNGRLYLEQIRRELVSLN